MKSRVTPWDPPRVKCRAHSADSDGGICAAGVVSCAGSRRNPRQRCGFLPLWRLGQDRVVARIEPAHPPPCIYSASGSWSAPRPGSTFPTGWHPAGPRPDLGYHARESRRAGPEMYPAHPGGPCPKPTSRPCCPYHTSWPVRPAPVDSLPCVALGAFATGILYGRPDRPSGTSGAVRHQGHAFCIQRMVCPCLSHRHGPQMKMPSLWSILHLITTVAFSAATCRPRQNGALPQTSALSANTGKMVLGSGPRSWTARKRSTPSGAASGQFDSCRWFSTRLCRSPS